MHVCGRNYTKRELERRTGNLNQIGGTRHYNLISGRSKGVEAIEFNTGTGFQTAVDYAAGSGAVRLCAADLDGDTDVDLAVVNNQGGAVSVLRNNGSGTFHPHG